MAAIAKEQAPYSLHHQHLKQVGVAPCKCRDSLPDKAPADKQGATPSAHPYAKQPCRTTAGYNILKWQHAESWAAQPSTTKSTHGSCSLNMPGHWLQQHCLCTTWRADTWSKTDVHPDAGLSLGHPSGLTYKLQHMQQLPLLQHRHLKCCADIPRYTPNPYLRPGYKPNAYLH